MRWSTAQPAAGSAGAAYIDGLVFNTATPSSDGVNATAWLNYPKLALVGTYA
jgi:hypothetical protein